MPLYLTLTLIKVASLLVWNGLNRLREERHCNLTHIRIVPISPRVGSPLKVDHWNRIPRCAFQRKDSSLRKAWPSC